MRVLFVASEAVPFIKTGGLADVIGSLPKELVKQGLEVSVILPKYEDIPLKWKNQLILKKALSVPVGWRNQYGGLMKTEHEGVTYYFIDNEYYFKRSGLYGYDDEGERFSFFCRAVLEALPYLDKKPNVIHCHDWQAGMVPLLMKAHYGHLQFYRTIKTMFTIHNLRYQGNFPYSILGGLLGLGNEYFTSHGVEYFEQVSFMKAGLVYSDILTTVSDTYAKEIQMPFYGEGMDGVLRNRSDQLIGIVNGIDYETFNPATDSSLFVNFSDSYEDKMRNKLALQARLGLPQNEKIPMLVLVTRLVQQKGMDLFAAVMEDILHMDLQFIVLGTGDPKYETMFREASFRHTTKMSAQLLFDEDLARKIYAASDLFLMPSQFEPCGIGQLIALRYHSLPIVRETGGLKDTVVSFNEFTGEGHGFSFAHFNAHEMLFTIQRAIGYLQHDVHRQQLWENMSKLDFSWERSAKQYIELYERITAK